MSVSILEGVSIPKAKKKRAKTENPEVIKTLFSSKWDKKKKEWKISPPDLVETVKVYERGPKDKIYLALVKHRINPITKQDETYTESRTANFQLEKKTTPYGEFTKSEIAKWKREHPNQKVDLPKLSKMVAKKWKVSPEKQEAEMDRRVAAVKKRKK